MASLFRPGSWSLGPVKLPEFGITERIQSIFQPQKPLTQSRGSNLFGPSGAQAPAPQPFIGPKPMIGPN